jgi:hypothetical protein
MITKKLAVPLINEKILAQAQHCYIATSNITDAGFDFIRTRIPPGCKINIVTSLDGVTSPNVLQRVLRHYQGRITFNIYTRNVLHANLYVFDLPFRKSVAFVGSGSASLEGLKDHEELFWKITDAKEIESLMSWYTSYFEFGTPVSENLVREYEQIYPPLITRELNSIREKELAIRLSHYTLDGIRFRSQYFKKEDFTALAPPPGVSVEKVAADQDSVKEKLMQLGENVRAKSTGLPPHSQLIISSHGRTQSYDFTFSHNISDTNFISIGITPFEIRTAITLGTYINNLSSRQNLHFRLKEDDFKAALYSLLSTLGTGYTIQVLTSRKMLGTLSNDKAMAELLESDYGYHLPVVIEKLFSPAEAACADDKIVDTLTAELRQLQEVFVKLIK